MMTHQPTNAVFALLAAATLGGCAVADDIAGVARADVLRPSTAIAPPPAGIATGVFIDGAPLGKPGLSAWDAWSAQVGKRPLYIMWYTDWSSTFQSYAVNDAYGRGSVPVITWEMKNRRADIPYADVLSGKWNKYIDTWAAAAKTDGRAFFLRFGHEMNGDWYGWSGARNGASPAAAQQFVATWRYVRDRFTRVGATNVTWVWCVNAESVPNASWNAVANYYPGDAYVDWTCADGYNWGTSQTVANAGWTSRWQTFDEIFGATYQRVVTIAPSKPFMIGEFASSESGGSKAAWISDAASRMPTAYPQLRAFIWFNMNKETDWRAESSAASLAAFKSAFGAATYIWR
ncbi:MAG TPA: glycosyl hydrolase [Gemmatimonadaceae bacterium]|nr:glycosyl hydrolase [Gemmatimonadaceae bacterium]